MSVNVTINTSLGTLKAELYEDKAPITVKNFLVYVDEGFYNGTIFHRVIPNFMIQGGGFTPDMHQKATRHKSRTKLKTVCLNERGTLAMARTSVVDSATCQSLSTTKTNAFLDFRIKPSGLGYCVFGKVTDGLDVLDKIAAVEQGCTAPVMATSPWSPSPLFQ